MPSINNMAQPFLDRIPHSAHVRSPRRHAQSHERARTPRRAVSAGRLPLRLRPPPAPEPGRRHRDLERRHQGVDPTPESDPQGPHGAGPAAAGARRGCVGNGQHTHAGFPTVLHGKPPAPPKFPCDQTSTTFLFFNFRHRYVALSVFIVVPRHGVGERAGCMVGSN